MDSDPQGAFSATTGRAPLHQEQAVTVVTTTPGQKVSSEIPTSTVMGRNFGSFPSAYYAVLIAVLVVAGSYSILPVWLSMCRVWLTDPLRSIGAVFPLVALLGTLSAWRRIGWSMHGTLWGLPIIALSMLIARFSTSLILILRVSQHYQSVLHPGLIVFLYGAGAVLLFGGTRLLRAAIAPLCFLLLVDPVPHFYNAVVDMPLQFLSANTARHFAHLIGLQPSGQQLRMMFSPDFGMQIVPGCNGVRGSITLFYLALIYGYMRHLKARALALTALGAFLGGYALNLLRLCVLVIYYRIGLSHPSIQSYGAGVDYAIGCTLFLFATLAIGLFIRWIEPERQETDAAVAARSSAHPALQIGYSEVACIACFLIVSLAFIMPTLGKANSLRVSLPNEQALLGSLPAQVGDFKLTHTYAEHDPNGLVQFAMADYAAPPDSSGSPRQLTFGIYVGMGMHMVASSRFIQGIRPEWTGSLDAVNSNAQRSLPVHFVETLFDDGVSRQYNAESACYETGCSANIEPGSKSLLIVVPKMSNLVFASTDRRLSILLRKEWADTDATPSAVQRTQFESDTRQFIKQINLQELVREDGTSM